MTADRCGYELGLRSTVMWRRFRPNEWRRGRAWFTAAPVTTEEDEVRAKARRKHLRRQLRKRTYRE